MSKHFGSDFNEFYIECHIESLENYIKYLEGKLKDIECGDCYKNMLDCKCDLTPDVDTGE